MKKLIAVLALALISMNSFSAGSVGEDITDKCVKINGALIVKPEITREVPPEPKGPKGKEI